MIGFSREERKGFVSLWSNIGDISRKLRCSLNEGS